MRLAPFITFIFLLLSCGQDENNSSVSGQKNLCDLNGSSVDCTAIEGADGLGIDLLNALIDVPVQIEETEIIFLRDKAVSASGRRITCKASVRNGEIYRYSLQDDKLLLMTEEGSFEYSRISDGEGLQGVWIWKGFVDQGMHLRKSITFIDDNRVVLRHHCEL